MARLMGNAIANDCIEHDVDVLLGPGTNLKRTPLCGRNFEYFSEDPLLSGLFAKAFIEGVQEKHVGATLKHYACNNREYSRYWSSMEIDEQTLHEIYLKPFKVACEAKPWLVMSSYNLVNGVRMSENKELYDVLRNEYNFDGVIVSDWEAVQSSKKSIESGMDLIMPYKESYENELLESLENSELNLECLNNSSQRMLELIKKNSIERANRKLELTEEERIKISQTIIEDGIVLLKNDGVLPLSKNNKVLVTGYPAVRYYRGIGSSEVIPNREYKTLIDSLNEVGIKSEYSLTVEMSEFNSIVYGNVHAACLKAQESDATIVTVGNGHGVEIESRDRQNIKLSKEEYDLVKYLRKYSKKLIVIVYAGSAVDLNLIHELSDAVILAGFGGQCVSDALANILCGNISPSGRLSETYPKSLDDIPSTHSYMDEKVMVYKEKENIGYRYFTSKKVDVLYPFGYGLSYANFKYSNFNIEVIDNNIIVCVDVFNNSSVTAKEVVQLYCYRDDVTNRPLKELKAFTKIVLQPGETKRVQITLGKKDFYDYDVDNKIWKLLEHNFRLAISKDCNNDLFIKKINV
jgi:beta-glucosidase